MGRVNITVPDEVIAQARAAGLNLSRVATAALVDELDRRSKVDALDAHLAELERTLGPIPADEQAAAARWLDDAMASSTSRRGGPRRRRSA